MNVCSQEVVEQCFYGILTKALYMVSKNKSTKERQKIKSMHKIYSKQPTLSQFLNKYVWVDTFERNKSSDSNDDEDQVLLFYLPLYYYSNPIFK